MEFMELLVSLANNCQKEKVEAMQQESNRLFEEKYKETLLEVERQESERHVQEVSRIPEIEEIQNQPLPKIV